MKRKLLSVLLAFCMVSAALPQSALAAEPAPGPLERAVAALEALPGPEELGGTADNPWAEDVLAAYRLADALSEEDRARVPGALEEKLEALVHICSTATDCPDLTCPWHNSAWAAGREENPAPLTLNDLIRDYGVEPPMAPNAIGLDDEPSPQTIIITSDNENNSHTGGADGDLDVYLSAPTKIFLLNLWYLYTQAGDEELPIEVSFELTEDEMPTQSAYVAIKAFDVDEEEGEGDYVYLNDDIFLDMDIPNEIPADKQEKFDEGDFGYRNQENIGRLTGTNGTWNTTVLRIPLDKLRVGKNTISINVASDWAVQVDWVQIILDGGDATETGFSLELGTPETGGGSVRVPVTAAIQGSGSYQTEYTLYNEAGDEALAAAFGSPVSASETVRLAMPAGARAGYYTIMGLIKDTESEQVLAMDEVTFYYDQDGVRLVPQVSHEQDTYSLTNRDVTLTLDVAAPAGVAVTGVTPPAGVTQVAGTCAYTVPANGSYTFSVAYTYNGSPYTYAYTAPVTNIDKTLPEVSCGSVTVLEGTSDEDVRAALEAALTAADENGVARIAWDIPADVAGTPGSKTASVTVTDRAGNAAEAEAAITVTALPLSLSLGTPAENGGEFTFSATLESTGGNAVTAWGFVWGSMQYPTLSINNGSWAAAGSLSKGQSFEHTAGGIAPEIRYYVRAYVTTGAGQTYYSGQADFGIDAPSYGAFSVKNNGDSTFTITRAGGAAGTQTVYYRTVSGSAVSGTHFTGKAGSVTFGEGVTAQTVAVDERGVSQAYNGSAATAYSNADRVYFLEIYRVTGGGSIDPDGSMARRIMAMDDSHAVERDIFHNYQTISGKNHNHGDYDDDDGLGWSNGLYGSDRESIQIASALTTPGYWQSLSGVEVRYKMTFTAKEENDGYQHIQVTPGQDRRGI